MFALFFPTSGIYPLESDLLDGEENLDDEDWLFHQDAAPKLWGDFLRDASIPLLVEL